MRVICPWKHTALQQVLVPLKPSFTDPWQNFCGHFLSLTGNTVITLKMATSCKHSSNAQCCSDSWEGQHKLVLFLEMFHLKTVVGIRLFVFLPCCHCGKCTRGKLSTWRIQYLGLQKKKRNLQLVKNGKFELEPQYAGLPHKTYKFWLSKRRTDYPSADHKIIAQVLAKTGPCSTWEQKRQLFINDNRNKIKVIKQTDTSLNINFLVICCSANLLFCFKFFIQLQKSIEGSAKHDT